MLKTFGDKKHYSSVTGLCIFFPRKNFEVINSCMQPFCVLIQMLIFKSSLS